MFWIYNILLTLLAPLWVPIMYLNSRKRTEKPNWKERSGNIERKFQKDDLKIWVHAVSVGEVVAAGPLLKELRNQEPECKIILSVTTSSGHHTATQSLLNSGLVDQLTYFPIDVVRFQLSALTSVRPHAIAILETELWLNFLWAANQIGIKSLLVNGRISEKSFAKCIKIKAYYRAIFHNLGQALMQTEADASRAKLLGANDPEVFGNTKFDDVNLASDDCKSEWFTRLQMNANEFPVIIIGSARGNIEHEIILNALAEILTKNPDLRVIYAPRHIEGADILASSIEQKLGSVARKSKGESGPIILLDTYGELSQAYSVGDIAIIGGGFDKLGGQNLLQPMASGLPVIRGQHFENFQWIVDRTGEESGVFVANESSEIAELAKKLLSNESERRLLGASAKAFVKSHQGASEKYASRILAAAKEVRNKQIASEINRKNKRS